MHGVQGRPRVVSDVCHARDMAERALPYILTLIYISLPSARQAPQGVSMRPRVQQ